MAATSGSTSLSLFASFRIALPHEPHTSLFSYCHLPLPPFFYLLPSWRSAIDSSTCSLNQAKFAGKPYYDFTNLHEAINLLRTKPATTLVCETSHAPTAFVHQLLQLLQRPIPFQSRSSSSAAHQDLLTLGLHTAPLPSN